MALQDTDLIYINRGGDGYKIEYGEFKNETRDYAYKFENAANGIDVEGIDQHIEDKLNVTLNVTDFGADPQYQGDSTAAIQAAVDAAIEISDVFPCTLYFPAGSYRITDQINIIAAGGDRLEIVGGAGHHPAVEIVCSFHGSGTFLNGDPKAAFYFANKTGTPDDYMRSCGISGFTFKRQAGGFGAPVGIDMRAMAQGTITSCTFGSWDNTCVRMTSPQNVKVDRLVLFAGGASYASYANENVTCTQSADVLTANSTGIFTAEDAGRTFSLWGTGGSSHKRKVVVEEYLASNRVRVSPVYTDANARSLKKGSGFAKIFKDSFNVDTSISGFLNPITETATGKPIWFKPTTGDNMGLHRGVMVSRVDNAVTLDTQAPFSSSKCTYATPAIEIYPEPGVYGDISDVKFINCQFENCRGLNVAIQNASVVEFVACKVHSEQTVTPENYTESGIWLDQVDGSFCGSFDGQTLGDYKIYVTNQTSTFAFTTIHARSCWFEKVFGVGKRNPLFSGSTLSIGNVSLTSSHPTFDTFSSMVYDYNTDKVGYTFCGSYASQGTSQGGQIGTALGPNVFIEDTEFISQPYMHFGRTDIISGVNAPDGNIKAPPGSIYLRFSDSGQGNLYIKKSGTSTSGWQTIDSTTTVEARLAAIESNEIIDDATDSALLQLIANASSRLDSIEARLNALEGGGN